MNITIIIPTLNEAALLGRLLERLLTTPTDGIEILVIDGGSTDKTEYIAKKYGVKFFKSPCSRAKQMNFGAAKAKYNVLYFIHADTLPPKSWYTDAIEYLQKQHYPAACYRSKFESNLALLRVNEFFTRFYWLVARGGDQSLFITREKFNELGHYDESMAIMEEYPLIQTLMKNKEMALIPKPILISTRKYDERSWLKVSRANYIAFKLFKKGVSTQKIRSKYKELLG